MRSGAASVAGKFRRAALVDSLLIGLALNPFADTAGELFAIEMNLANFRQRGHALGIAALKCGLLFQPVFSSLTKTVSDSVEAEHLLVD